MSDYFDKLKEKLYSWMRLTNKPVVKLYHGYGNSDEIVVFGHVLHLSPLPRKRYRRNIWTNTLALIRLFMVRPMAGVRVICVVGESQMEVITEKDGFFRAQFRSTLQLSPGWHEVTAFLAEGVVRSFYGTISTKGEFYIPHSHQYAIISDIDDTFLVSHSSNFRKRLYVLLTENAYSRMPFEGVVRHYQALALAGTNPAEPNPFFYVSSSEWNLYNYIVDFTRKNELPGGVFLLSQIKKLSQAWRTGQNNHNTKFLRITRILQAYPNHSFILLGDDSQQDPFIYASVVEHFHTQIKAVYLRNVFQKNMTLVQAAIQEIEKRAIPVCHFKHSKDALAHSASIGLI